MGWATDQTLPHPRFLPDRRAGATAWDRFILNCIKTYQEHHHMPKHDPLSESAFNQAEAGMKIDKIGNGSFGMEAFHAPTHKIGGRLQSPAQHASVVRAGKASAAKRHAKAAFKGLK